MEAFPDVDLDYQEIAFLPQATKEISSRRRRPV